MQGIELLLWFFFIFLGNCIKPITNTIFVLNNINVLFCVVAHSKKKKKKECIFREHSASRRCCVAAPRIRAMDAEFKFFAYRMKNTVIDFCRWNWICWAKCILSTHTHTPRYDTDADASPVEKKKQKKKKQNTNLMLMDWYLIPFEWMLLLCGLMIAFSFALFVAIGNFCYLNAGLSKLYSDRSRAFVQRRHCPNLRNKFCHVHPMRQNAR